MSTENHDNNSDKSTQAENTKSQPQQTVTIPLEEYMGLKAQVNIAKATLADVLWFLIPENCREKVWHAMEEIKNIDIHINNNK